MLHGPSAAEDWQHALSGATSAEYAGLVPASHRHHSSPDANAPEIPCGHHGKPFECWNTRTNTQMLLRLTGFSSSMQARIMRENGGTGGRKRGVRDFGVQGTCLKNLEAPKSCCQKHLKMLILYMQAALLRRS